MTNHETTSEIPKKTPEVPKGDKPGNGDSRKKDRKPSLTELLYIENLRSDVKRILEQYSGVNRDAIMRFQKEMLNWGKTFGMSYEDIVKRQYVEHFERVLRIYRTI